VSGSFKFRFCIPTLLTTLIYLTTVLAKPDDVVKPVDIFQSIKLVETVARVIKPVAGKV